ncbi:copper resistance protein CopC/CopD [Actinoplanes hulinensis]|uniref:Copper resistance protein CopC/CopD n=1 Tax=Actinoplanes hulinensis TaxID=1144547 RepID=A0ABS7B387_9ACTN|nr:copper resistance protein CopC [Actinoplanes hulinensis]MBW6435259.1 copper resistance protein CopC/CopD [Actinoplanes hulinensis]
MTRVLLFLLVLLTGTLALPASPAAAHAAPVGASPAPGSLNNAAPTEVTVTFSEPVTPVEGRVQVIAPDGERISGKVTVEGSVVRIPIRKAEHPLGTYLISFRVISADSHPVGGAITFSVGAPSARPEAPVESAGAHPSVTAAIPIFKTMGYGGITLIAGPALFLAFLWPRTRSRRGALLTIRIGLGLTALATAGALGTQAQQSSGAALWQVTATELGEVATSRFGLLLLARLAIVGALAVLLPPLLRKPRRTVTAPRTAPQPVLVGAGAPAPEPAPAPRPQPRVTSRKARAYAVLGLSVAGLATWPLTGHAIAAPLPAVTVGAGVVHMAAMAVWIGGLVTLTVFLLRRTERRVLGVILPVWSRWAALSVLWLVLAGAAQSVIQVGRVSALWETDYGRLLSAKIGILAVVLAVAAGARRLVLRGSGGTGLRRLVGVEVVATVLILGLSSVLVQVDTGRIAAAKDRQITGAGKSETLTSDLYAVQFNIYPVELGEYNTVHAYLYAPDGSPMRAEEWQVTARLLDPALEAVPQPFAPLPDGNQALGSMSFPLPGTYEITFTIRVSDIDRASVKTTVTVER